MRFAVTGANGPFGSQAISTLLELGVPAQEIVAVVRDPAKAVAATRAGVSVRHGDYADPDSLPPALAGVDRLLLVSGPEVGLRVAQHRNVVSAAAAAGVQHLCYTSVLNADRTSLHVGEDHRQTEQSVRDSGIAYTLLRNSFYTENYAGRVSTFVAQGEIVGASGEGRISAALRSDFAAAAAAALTGAGHEGKTYELGGDAFTLSELAQTISTAGRAVVRYRNLPLHAYRTHLLRSGVDPATTTVLVQLEQAVARGDLLTDSDDLTRLLGRRPAPLVSTLF